MIFSENRCALFPIMLQRFRVVVFFAAGSRQARTSRSTFTRRTSGTPFGGSISLSLELEPLELDLRRTPAHRVWRAEKFYCVPTDKKPDLATGLLHWKL
jgi:hypothetical protein